MLKILLIVAGLLIIIVSLIVLVGMLLPQSHRATRTARFGQSAETVWKALTDYVAHSQWRTGLKEMKRLEDLEGNEIWKEVRGRGDSITYMTVESEPPRMLKSRIINNKQFGGTWTWEIEPEGEEACTLTITEDGEIYNPVFRFMARFVMGYRATMSRYLTDLSGHFGQPVDFQN